MRHSLLRCNRGKKRCIAPTVEGLTNPTEISDCPEMMSLLLLKNLNLVKAMDMTGYHQIIIVMVPHYYHVIFLHYSNCMITHCYVPNPFCISTIIPIPKGSNRSTRTVKNYRGIALSSLLSKIFVDLIV